MTGARVLDNEEHELIDLYRELKKAPKDRKWITRNEIVSMINDLADVEE